MSEAKKFEAEAKKAADEIIFGHEEDLQGHHAAMVVVITAALQAAYNQGLSDAAKIAERCELGNGDIAEEIAAAIRQGGSQQ